MSKPKIVKPKNPPRGLLGQVMQDLAFQKEHGLFKTKQKTLKRKSK